MDRLSELGPLAAYRVRDAGARSEVATGRRVVFLHGFTQNAECIGAFGASLSHDNELLAVDLPGHGASAGLAGLAEADLWQTADLVSDTTGPASYIGYSMGGRIGLHLALRHPEAVDALVLIGATAGISDDDLRAERARQDRETAERIELLGTPGFVAEWLAQPLFATLPPEGRFEEARGRNDAVGLASSIRNVGTGSMEPLWDRLGEIRCPVLIISGELDSKFTELGAGIAERIGPAATAVVVAGSGHSVHLEQPERCSELISKFLASTAPT